MSKAWVSALPRGRGGDRRGKKGRGRRNDMTQKTMESSSVTRESLKLEFYTH